MKRIVVYDRAAWGGGGGCTVYILALQDFEYIKKKEKRKFCIMRSLRSLLPDA